MKHTKKQLEHLKDVFYWLNAYCTIAYCLVDVNGEDLLNVAGQLYASNTLNLTDKVEFDSSLITRVEKYINAELKGEL